MPNTASTMKLKRLAIEKVIPYARNPRHNEAAVDKVAASIQEFGWKQPIVVDANGVIVAGHTRYLAAKRLKLAQVPVIVADDLTPAQVKAYRLADNRTHDDSSWNDELLALELQDLDMADFNLELTGFGDDEICQLLGQAVSSDGDGGLTDEDATPPVEKVAVSRLGDLWLLGEHRLLCGDATSADDITRVMNGERAVLFATDPPYLVDFDGQNHPPNRRGTNKGKDWSDSYVEQPGAARGRDFYRAFCRLAKDLAIAEDAAWYCWHASRRQAMLEGVWAELSTLLHQQIVWVKSRPVLGRFVYMHQHEPCLFGWPKGHKPPVKTDYPEGESQPTTVWDIPSSEVETLEHPTSKPVRIFTIPIEIHTQPGNVCYEPFSGSGSQIIAAERTGRRCFALELSPLFVDVAVRRWQAFTGEQATLEGDGREFDTLAEVRGREAA
jgi:DNA modification methylase